TRGPEGRCDQVLYGAAGDGEGRRHGAARDRAGEGCAEAHVATAAPPPRRRRGAAGDRGRRAQLRTGQGDRGGDYGTVVTWKLPTPGDAPLLETGRLPRVGPIRGPCPPCTPASSFAIRSASRSASTSCACSTWCAAWSPPASWAPVPTAWSALQLLFD